MPDIVAYKKACSSCGGSGSEICRHCEDTGVNRAGEPCSMCSKTPVCRKCNGSREESVVVTIPEGARSPCSSWKQQNETTWSLCLPDGQCLGRVLKFDTTWEFLAYSIDKLKVGNRGTLIDSMIAVEDVQKDISNVILATIKKESDQCQQKQ